MLLWSVLVTLTLYLDHFGSVTGQFPTICAGNITDPDGDGTCCPIPPGFTEPCGGPGRGRCDKLNVTFEPLANWGAARDDRYLWPTSYLKTICHCEQSFWGYACQECQFGLSGSDCKTRKVVVRRDLQSLNRRERKKLVDAFVQSKTFPLPEYGIIARAEEKRKNVKQTTLSLYDFFNALHFFVSRPTDIPKAENATSCFIQRALATERARPKNSFDGAHSGPALLPWHRFLLLWFERELQKMTADPDFALPYWNWATKGNTCEVCSNDLFGATDSTSSEGFLEAASPFSTWNAICQNKSDAENCIRCDPTLPGDRLRRRPGGNAQAPTLPGMDNVHAALKCQSYDTPPYTDLSDKNSFRNTLEGYADESAASTDASDPSSAGDEAAPSLLDGLRFLIAGSHRRRHMQLKSSAPRDPGSLKLLNLVHFFLNGTLVSPTVGSLSDPIFLPLYGFSDLIYETWLRKNGPSPDQLPVLFAPPGHGRNSNLVAFYPPVPLHSMHVDSRTLGYDYALPEELKTEEITVDAFGIENEASVFSVFAALTLSEDEVSLSNRSPGTVRRNLMISAIFLGFLALAGAVLFVARYAHSKIFRKLQNESEQMRREKFPYDVSNGEK